MTDFELIPLEQAIAEEAAASQASPRSAIRWHGDAQSFTPRRELVKGLIPAGEVILIGGQSGAGKTFVALDLARALASGGTFFGLPVREPGGTLIIAAEGAGTIAERLDAVQRDGGFPSPLPVAWLPLNGSLNDPAVLKSVTADAKRIASEMPLKHGVPLKLIIVDTIAAAFTIQDENDASKATAAMKILQGLHVGTGALVAGIAHYGKNGETGIRGSSAFTASADAILAVNADRDPASGKVKARSISLTKSRWRDTGWTCGFDLKSVPVGIDEDGEEIWSAVVLPGAVTAAKASAERGWSRSLKLFRECLIEAIGDFGQNRLVGGNGAKITAVDIEDVRPIFYGRYATGEGIGDKSAKAKRSALRSALGNAVRQKLVVSETVGGVEWLWIP